MTNYKIKIRKFKNYITSCKKGGPIFLKSKIIP